MTPDSRLAQLLRFAIWWAADWAWRASIGAILDWNVELIIVLIAARCHMFHTTSSGRAKVSHLVICFEEDSEEFVWTRRTRGWTVGMVSIALRPHPQNRKKRTMLNRREDDVKKRGNCKDRNHLNQARWYFGLQSPTSFEKSTAGGPKCSSERSTAHQRSLLSRLQHGMSFLMYDKDSKRLNWYVPKLVSYLGSSYVLDATVGLGLKRWGAVTFQSCLMGKWSWRWKLGHTRYSQTSIPLPAQAAKRNLACQGKITGLLTFYGAFKMRVFLIYLPFIWRSVDFKCSCVLLDSSTLYAISYTWNSASR
jgi:hypothetical protein